MQKITKHLICITILLLPSYLIQFSVFGIPTNALEILILLTFIAYLIEGKCLFLEFYKKHKIISGAILAIFLGLLSSTIINNDYQAGLGIIKSWFAIPLIFAWVVYEEKQSGQNSENIYKCLYLSTFWVAAVGLAYYFIGRLTFDGRLQGIFNSPNYLAMYLASALIIGAFFWRDVCQKKCPPKIAEFFKFFDYCHCVLSDLFLRGLGGGHCGCHFDQNNSIF